MRILVLTLMMSFLSHSAFGAAEGGGAGAADGGGEAAAGGAKAGGSPTLVSLDSDVRTLRSQLDQANTRSEDLFSRTIDRYSTSSAKTMSTKDLDSFFSPPTDDDARHIEEINNEELIFKLFKEPKIQNLELFEHLLAQLDPNEISRHKENFQEVSKYSSSEETYHKDLPRVAQYQILHVTNFEKIRTEAKEFSEAEKIEFMKRLSCKQGYKTPDYDTGLHFDKNLLRMVGYSGSKVILLKHFEDMDESTFMQKKGISKDYYKRKLSEKIDSLYGSTVHISIKNGSINYFYPEKDTISLLSSSQETTTPVNLGVFSENFTKTDFRFVMHTEPGNPGLPAISEVGGLLGLVSLSNYIEGIDFNDVKYVVRNLPSFGI